MFHFCRIIFQAIVLYCGTVATVWAHAFWVVPVEGHVQPGERVVFDLRIGPRWPGESMQRDTTTLISRFELDDGVQRTPIAGRENLRPVGHYKATVSGANFAVMTSYPHSAELSGEKFEAYLAEEGLDDALEIRRKFGLKTASARERFRRNVKTLVLVGDNSDGFDRLLNLPFELVPLTDPLRYSAGEPFVVRVLRNGRPLADTQVVAGLRDSETTLHTRTDMNGNARLEFPAGGMWMLYAVDIAPSTTPDADWESIWTSLTFEVNP
ncbi:DUF4198 domain-containing protein [Paracoccus onubensis]|uniref:DUF4198 domain-containing protein n=1 Tax=Paracoccus onubensis TaxID=1675788 RepID=A0A418SME1_9RHOB|nr:DUF4198 domain-containing protein [Paracoccus onubensis]RJE82067.1 DUF4198 domain-containing protein [Paracoccus onubensis]